MMREEKNGFRDILARVIFQHIARQRHDSGRVSIMSKLTESDRVFDGIVTDILAGVLRPRDQLSERELVSRFGVSRTPVREAVKRLLERGFIEPGPRGVATVIDISLEDLRKLYALRQQLESTAAREIVANIAPQEISELKEINKLFGKALEQRDLVKMLEVRADFHAVLSAATRNRWLEQVLVMLRNKAYMVRHYHWQDFERAAATLDIHTQMIKALEQRDEEQFVALVSQQIGAAITVYENRLHAPSWNVPQGKQRTTAPKRRVTSSDKTANSSPAVKRNY
ncbi:GntR family transcriptional regulator [Pusillimonas sp.]|uniref:GntR family transcriptional regulator n=1 Tax=Pusillimonas sp. TaxID=3040095 RepID=UPI0037C841E3